MRSLRYVALVFLVMYGIECAAEVPAAKAPHVLSHEESDMVLAVFAEMMDGLPLLKDTFIPDNLGLKLGAFGSEDGELQEFTLETAVRGCSCVSRATMGELSILQRTPKALAALVARRLTKELSRCYANEVMRLGAELDAALHERMLARHEIPSSLPPEARRLKTRYAFKTMQGRIVDVRFELVTANGPFGTMVEVHNTDGGSTKVLATKAVDAAMEELAAYYAKSPPKSADKI